METNKKNVLLEGLWERCDPPLTALSQRFFLMCYIRSPLQRGMRSWSREILAAQSAVKSLFTAPRAAQ